MRAWSMSCSAGRVKERVPLVYPSCSVFRAVNLCPSDDTGVMLYPRPESELTLLLSTRGTCQAQVYESG